MRTAVSKRGTTVDDLINAVLRNNQARVQQLIQQGVGVNATDTEGFTALYAAAQCGHVPIVRYLLDTACANVNGTDNDGRTPLFTASRYGHVDVVKLLLETGRVDVNAAKNDGATPLFIASQEGHVDVVKLLLETGRADVNAPMNTGLTPLYSASQQGHVDIVKLLLETGHVNINAPTDKGCTPLFIASQEGHMGVVKLLLETGRANVNTQMNIGWTALHIASQQGHVDVVKLLLETGRANVNATDNDGRTPLFTASRYGHVGVVKLLLETDCADANAAKNNGVTPLFIATQEGHLDVVKLLLEMGRADVNAPMNTGLTPLYSASQQGHVDIVRLLLETGHVDINAPNGYTPLFVACHKGHVGVVKLLLETGRANVNAPANEGWTALHIASQERHLDIVKLLLKLGHADVNAPTNTGSTPLYIASVNGHVGVVKVLLETGRANVNLQEEDGWTALYVASQNGHLNVVEALVEVGRADLRLPAKAGETPLDVARQNNHADIVSYLQDRLDQSLSLPSVTLPATHASQSNVTNTAVTSPPSKSTANELSTAMASKDLARVQDMIQEGANLKAHDANGNGSVTLEAIPSLTSEQEQMRAAVSGRSTTFAVSEQYVQTILTNDVLGQGFFGTVFRGFDRTIGCTFAIKAINTEILVGGDVVEIERAKKTFEREQETLCHFRHPNIAALFAYSFPATIRGNYYLVYEIAEKGSLNSFWNNDFKRLRLTFRRRVQIALDVMTALRFLHVGNAEKRISSCFHRDIKSANIVLQQDLTAQLIDCGLAKFVVDDVETNSSGSHKGTPGYICPEYSIGSIPFDCSCDVYSFGITLIELWTGKLQNHKDESGRAFNFMVQYVAGKKGPKREILGDADPTFGFDSFEDMPDYMTRFAKVALSCLDDHEDIPLGDTIMRELVGILYDCVVHEDGSPPKNQDHICASEPVGPHSCERCQSFRKMPRRMICTFCFDAEEQRKATQELCLLLRALAANTNLQLDALNLATSAIRDGTNAANVKLDIMAPLLGNLDAHISSSIPRLFFMVPAEKRNPLRHFREFVHSMKAKKYYLYFVCAHTKRPVEAPIKIHMTKPWVQAVAPVLAISLQVLQCGLSTAGVPLNVDGLAFQLTSSVVDEMLLQVSSIMETELHSHVWNRLGASDGMGRLDETQIPELTGDVYDHMLEKATEQRAWRQHMEPVRTETNPATLWVSKAIADDKRHGYIKAH